MNDIWSTIIKKQINIDLCNSCMTFVGRPTLSLKKKVGQLNLQVKRSARHTYIYSWGELKSKFMDHKEVENSVCNAFVFFICESPIIDGYISPCII